MKKIFTTWVITLYAIASFTQPSFWIQKANFPGANNDNVTFSIGSLGYLYTGGATNNFYQYDPATNTWSALANFPGLGRSGAAGFATDSFGFIGSGAGTDTNFHDFYKYDPVANTWSSSADYPDTTTFAFSFSINNIGYFSGGFNQTVASNKCYGYNPATDQWTQMANLPVAMGNGFSAVVGTNAYCGLGSRSNLGACTDTVFQYNASANSWATEASFQMLNNHRACLYSFVVSGNIFVMDPDTINAPDKGVAVYNPLLNSWSTTNIYPVPSYISCEAANVPSLALGIGNTGYFGGADNCTGLGFWQYDPADSFTVSSFTPDSVCMRASVSVNISTNLSFGSSNFFKLHFINSALVQSYSDSVAASSGGTYDFPIPFQATWPNPGAPVNFAVVSSNPGYLSQYTGNVVYIKAAPLETDFSSNYTFCNGSSALLLYSAASLPSINVWTSSPAGLQDSASHISYTPTQNTYIYLYSIDPLSGCSISDTFYVGFSDLPALNISDSVFAECAGTSVTLGGTVTANCAYKWTGGGLNDSTVNVMVAPVTNSTYQVQVTDTLNGCKTIGDSRVYIDTPPAQTICLVTVDSASNRNLVIWEKLDKYATDSFHIYRETSTNQYSVVGAVPRDSLSEFVDGGADPAVTSYRYKISAVDTCGHESALSPYHSTIYLQYIGNGQLSWTDYEIEGDSSTPVINYDVLIDTSGTSPWQLMTVVTGNDDGATDTNYTNHPNARYLVQAIYASLCTPTRSVDSAVFSNVAIGQPSGIITINKYTVQLYPNPVNNQLTVQSPLISANNLPVIYDVAGRIVSADYTLQTGKIVYNTSNLAEGVYSVKLTYTGQQVVKMFVKAR